MEGQCATPAFRFKTLNFLLETQSMCLKCPILLLELTTCKHLTLIVKRQAGFWREAASSPLGSFLLLHLVWVEQSSCGAGQVFVWSLQLISPGCLSLSYITGQFKLSNYPLAPPRAHVLKARQTALVCRPAASSSGAHAPSILHLVRSSSVCWFWFVSCGCGVWPSSPWFWLHPSGLINCPHLSPLPPSMIHL